LLGIQKIYKLSAGQSTSPIKAKFLIGNYYFNYLIPLKIIPIKVRFCSDMLKYIKLSPKATVLPIIVFSEHGNRTA